MAIESLVPTWRALARIEGSEDRVAAWRQDYEAAYPDVFESYFQHWGRRAACDAAARTMPTQGPSVEAAENRASTGIERMVSQLRRSHWLSKDDVPVVLLVGGATSNGWVTTLRGRPTLFLDLAMFPGPGADEVLVAHELIHIAQQQRVAEPSPGEATLAYTLAMEGVATALSRLARPGLSESVYLWNDEHHADWLHQCERQAAAVSTLARNLLTASNLDRACGPLLRNRNDGPVPARSGYWLADRLVTRDLEASAVSPQRLLAMDPDDCLAYISRHLTPA